MSVDQCHSSQSALVIYNLVQWTPKYVDIAQIGDTGVKLRAYAAVAWRAREISESVYPYNVFYKRNWTCARRSIKQSNDEKLLRQIFHIYL